MKFEFCEQPMGRTKEVQVGKLTRIMERRKLTLFDFSETTHKIYGP